MANDKKFVVKRGLATPNVDFANGGGSISATFLSTSNTLSFSGNTGQLFSITDSMSGTIFSVNDISGIPSIEVIDTGAVKLAETFGSVAIGANTITNYKFNVSGNTLFGNSVTFNSTIIANGAVGTSGFVLTSNGTGVYWAAANSSIASVATANNATFAYGKQESQLSVAAANTALFLQNRTWETAGAIGATVANTGAFTTLTASANVNLDSGTLFTDATTNRVGIGTITPAVPLQVIGSIRFASDTPGTNYLQFERTGSNAWKLASDGIGDVFNIIGNNITTLQNLTVGRGGLIVTPTLATATNAIEVNHTWNNATNIFTSLKVNATDTTSNASSMLMDLQVGGSSLFNVRKSGNVGLGGNTAPGQTLQVDGSVGIKNGIVANGSFGTSGFVLTSNGSVAYWASANTISGTVTSANNASYLNGKQESQLSVANAVFATTANNALFANSASFVYGKQESQLSVAAANTALFLNGANSQFYTNATNITTGTLAEARLPFRMNQNVRTTDDVTFANGTFTGTVSIGGNLVLTGNLISQNIQSLSVIDPLIKLGVNNASDAIWGGFTFHYSGSGNTTNHAGLVRSPSTKEFILMSTFGDETAVANNNTININDSSFTYANLQVNFLRIGNNTNTSTLSVTNYTGTANNASFAYGKQESQLSVANAVFATTAGSVLGGNVSGTVANANNASFLNGRIWETAGAIGATVANTGAFTSLTASANVNIDSGTLFTDATNNRVGINNTNPTTSLHVQGNALIGGDGASNYDFKLQRLNGGIRAVQHDFAAAANSPWILHGENLSWTGERAGTVESTQAFRPYYEAFAPAVGYKEFGFANVTSGNFTGTNLIPNLVLTGTGRVGVGTTNPITPFVVSNAGAGGLEFDGSTGLIQSYNRGTSAYQTMLFDAATIVFRPSGTEAARITATGNVAIGSTDAPTKLFVNGHMSVANGFGIFANGVLGSAGFVLTSNGSSLYWANAASISGTVASANNASFLNGRIWETAGAIGATVANTGAFTTLTASANVNIDSGTLFTDAVNNLVGIGNTNPTEKLQVDGRLKTSNGGVVLGDTNAVIYRNSNNLELITYAGYGINLMPAGNVGIGSTTAPTKLYVNGHMSVANGFGIYANGVLGANGLVLTSNGTSLYWGSVSASSGFTGNTVSANSTIIRNQSYAVNAAAGWVTMTLPSTVTTGDIFIVHTYGGNTRILNNSINIMDIGTGNDLILENGETVWLQAVNATAVDVLFTYPAGGTPAVVANSSFSTNANNSLFANSASFVYGKQESQLSVASSNTALFLQNRTWETAGAIGATVANTGAFTTLTASANVNIDSGVLFVDATTNRVGIGISSPILTELQVVGHTHSSTGVSTGTDAGRYTPTGYGTTTPNSGMGANASSVMALSGFNGITLNTNTTQRLRIDAGGNVSIGTTDSTPTRLFVNGHMSVANGFGIFANGTLGANGLVLTSNGTSLFWGSVSSGAATTANNANFLQERTWATPFAIGSTVANTGAFTTLNARPNQTGAVAGIEVSNNSIGIFMVPKAGQGAYNNLVSAGDNLIYFSNNSINGGNLVIGSWTDKFSGYGIRFSNTYDIAVVSNTFTINANTTINGNTTFNTSTYAINPTFRAYREAVIANTVSTAASTIDLSTSNIFNLNMTLNTTVSFINPPASGTAYSFMLYCKQDAGGSKTITWPASVKWPNSSVPTMSTGANKIDVFNFFTLDGGTTYLGALSLANTG